MLVAMIWAVILSEQPHGVNTQVGENGGTCDVLASIDRQPELSPTMIERARVLPGRSARTKALAEGDLARRCLTSFSPGTTSWSS